MSKLRNLDAEFKIFSSKISTQLNMLQEMARNYEITLKKKKTQGKFHMSLITYLST